jgi:hypothetical protein
MKKKKLKKRVKELEKLLESRKRRRPKKIVQLMEKVKGQLAAFRPTPVRRELSEMEMRMMRNPFPPLNLLTVREYRKMDPFWMTTMTGAMTGRVLGKGDGGTGGKYLGVGGL